MNKEVFYDATFERLTALKYYGLISPTKASLSKYGIDFLKQTDKEYYLTKISFIKKYKKTRHPDIFIECFRQFIKLTRKERNSIRKVVVGIRKKSQELFTKGITDYTILYETYITDYDLQIYEKFIDNIYKALKKKRTKDLIMRICDTALRNIIVGTKALINTPLLILKRLLKEIDAINAKQSNNENKENVINNLLEAHIETIIRNNFSSYFPNLVIIDNNKHYLTKKGNYIDILCREKNSNYYTVIELKRDITPSSALIQLLDYMNQISREFNTNDVKGILLCHKLDKRTKSALSLLKRNWKYGNKIVIIEFELNMKMKAYK
ncbi:MAG: hypothetical protein KatS3mg003_2373 [Candidatus Nitrosocaldaceae archaeon]|nr:MAG: hypothetical protein KatS3mg003_2373 [Candidatus Nitrosocaldaceae archaeon]